jgi:hypothetical protein
MRMHRRVGEVELFAGAAFDVVAGEGERTEIILKCRVTS